MTPALITIITLADIAIVAWLVSEAKQLNKEMQDEDKNQK